MGSVGDGMSSRAMHIPSPVGRYMRFRLSASTGSCPTHSLTMSSSTARILSWSRTSRPFVYPSMSRQMYLAWTSFASDLS